MQPHKKIHYFHILLDSEVFSLSNNKEKAMTIKTPNKEVGSLSTQLSFVCIMTRVKHIHKTYKTEKVPLHVTLFLLALILTKLWN